MGKARFPKGSDEAKEYMAMLRQIAKEKREAIANGELEPVDKPAKSSQSKNENMPIKVKETVIFEAKEEEPEPIRKVAVAPPAPPPNKFDKKPRPAPAPKLEPEPEGVLEEIEPTEGLAKHGVPTKKAQKPAKRVEEKPIIVKAPAKKVIPEVIAKFGVKADVKTDDSTTTLSAKGTGFEAKIEFKETEALVKVDLGFLLKPLKGKILETIEKQIKKVV